MIHLPKSQMIARYNHFGTNIIFFLFEKGVKTEAYESSYGKIIMKVYNETSEQMLGKIFTNGFITIDKNYDSFIKNIAANYEEIAKEVKKCEYVAKKQNVSPPIAFRFNPMWKEEKKFIAYKDGIISATVKFSNNKNEFKKIVTNFEKKVTKILLNEKIENNVSINSSIGLGKTSAVASMTKIKTSVTVPVKRSKTIVPEQKEHSWMGLKPIKRVINID